MAALERQHFWGCTLAKEKPEVKWLSTSEVDIGEVDVLNQLVLTQACLGSKAKDNVSHVVQVTTTGVSGDTITQPIVVLGSGVRQVECRLEFSAVATFKLIEGTGPVHLSGSHVQVLSDRDFEESEGASEDEGIASGKQSPVKGKTKPSPSPSPGEQAPPAKRAKLELENDVSEGEGSSDDEDDDDEPVELVPIKDVKAKKKPAVETKKLPQKAASPDKKAKSNLLEKEAEEGIEESEDEMEESDDEDEDDDKKDEDFDEDDSDEEEGDDGEDDDESDEEESEDDDEIANAILAKNKLRGHVNGKKTPDKKRPDRRTPQKKTPDTRTPKKTSVEASVNLEKTPDITTVKQKLLKSPNLPKKMDKFRNFMKTNMRVTDEKVVKELWGWLQQNKK